MAVTLKMIAERAGVSVMAVSTVLNHRGNSGVSAATRRRIENIARELNYHPNLLASSIRTGIVKTIAVITNWSDYAAMRNASEILYGIQHTAALEGYCVHLYGAENLEKTFAGIASQRIERVILISVDESVCRETAAYCRKMSFSLVFANSPAGFGFPGVLMDNFSAMYEIVSHLIRLGHRAIGLVCSPHALYVNRERHRGYEQAMRDAGLPVLPEWQTCGEYPNREGLHTLLTLPEDKKVSAVAAVASAWLCDIARFLLQNGLSVPRDLSLAGFCEDSQTAAYSLVPFSHSEYRPVEIGVNAASLLLNGKCALEADPPGTYLVKSVFVPMESTAAYRGTKKRGGRKQ